MKFKMSKHADLRAAQRGVRKRDIDLFFGYADVMLPCRNNCLSFSINHSGYQKMITSGVSVQAADGVKDMYLVLSSSGEVVTLIKSRDHRSKKYRQTQRASSRKRNRAWR
jgi:hypothetical protein